jgi:antitoxin (DNA-binding transcriptional repressor) of toxin-antitoxin stability system
MRVVGVRELKNKLSEYLRLVRRGETVLVTDRGEIVAELRRPDAELARRVPHPALLELARAGKVRLGAPNAPELYPPRPVRMPEGTAQALIDEDCNGG